MRYQAPSRLVLIQCITTEWTKRTREAVSAGTRNRLPETLPLPANRPGVPGNVEHQAADIYYHHTHYDEQNNYQKPSYQFWITLQSRLPNHTRLFEYGNPRSVVARPPISLILEGELLQIEFYPGKAPFYPPHWLERAAPPSDHLKPKKFPLVPG